jgi:hypothetical protein
MLVTNQRQIAEQLVRLAALDICKKEKQAVLGLKSQPEFGQGLDTWSEVPYSLPNTQSAGQCIGLN